MRTLRETGAILVAYRAIVQIERSIHEGVYGNCAASFR
jgi:hypothetical protein